MKRRRLVDPVFGFHWYFQIGGTQASAFQWYCKKFNLKVPETDETNAGCFGENDSVKYTGVIWITEKAGGSTYSHEIAHAVMHVCRVLELDPRQADEFQASYTGYLSKNLNQLAYRKKRK